MYYVALKLSIPVVRSMYAALLYHYNVPMSLVVVYSVSVEWQSRGE